MRLKENTVAIELAGHGLYVSSVTAVEAAAAQMTKRQMARAIASAFEGTTRAMGGEDFSVVSYWTQYSAVTLAIVYAGMFDPRDDYRADPPRPLSTPADEASAAARAAVRKIEGAR